MNHNLQVNILTSTEWLKYLITVYYCFIQSHMSLPNTVIRYVHLFTYEFMNKYQIYIIPTGVNFAKGVPCNESNGNFVDRTNYPLARNGSDRFFHIPDSNYVIK